MTKYSNQSIRSSYRRDIVTQGEICVGDCQDLTGTRILTKENVFNGF